jgi:protein-disulfide isomerase
MRTTRESFRRRWMYRAIVVAGILASAHVTYGHYVVLRNPLYFPWCDIGARLACTPAYVSRFGYVFGVPAGLLLLTLFLIAGALVLAGHIEENPLHASIAFASATVGVAVGMYQMYGTAVQLHLVCVPCAIAHAASLAVFTLASGDARMPARQALAAAWRLGRSGANPLLGGSFAAAVVFGVVAFFPEARPTAGLSASVDGGRDRVVSREALTRWYLSQPASREPRLAFARSVVLAKFNDFQCPPCRQAFFDYQPVIAQLRDRFGAAFTFTNIDFPLDAKCNRFVSATVHPIACEAAVAVRLAAKAGKAGALEAWLFTHQPELSAASSVWNGLREAAQVADGSANYAGALAALDDDIQLAHRLGVDSTPTFFLDGVRLGSGMSPAELVILVDAAARRDGVALTGGN